MDIAALSIVMNHGQLQQQASLSVMKMAMGAAAANADAVVNMASDMSKAMELSVQPHLGANVNINA